MISDTDIEGVFLITGGETFRDERGFFRESFKRNEFEEKLGKSWLHVQENHSLSKQNVLRGIHVAPWSKMVYCPYGRVLSILIDFRTDSPTFKRIYKLELGNNNLVKLFIPPLVGNSYLVLSEVAVYEYQVDRYFEKGLEQGVRWNDADLGIDWPIDTPVLSQKDQNNLTLKEYLAMVNF